MVKELRSLIHEKFPLDLRIQFELLSKRRDIINQEKQEEIIKLLQSSDITGIVPLGPGTNRYAFKLDGFVIKVATDRDGKIDNLKEFKMAKRLFPYVTKTYEVSSNGTLLVAEYVQPFMSYGEMLSYADKIREILLKISSIYLIGDVGISNNNFTNWGLRVGTDDPVCLDFAYVYDVNSDLFVCNKCNSGAMLIPNSDFTTLVCTNKGCKRETQFSEIRGRIGNEMHNQEIGDLTQEGYLMYDSHVETELDPEKSGYLKKEKANDKKDKKQKKKKHVTKDKSDEQQKSDNDVNNTILYDQREENYMETLGEKSMYVDGSGIEIEVLSTIPSTTKELTPGVVTTLTGSTEAQQESVLEPEVVEVVKNNDNQTFDYSKLNKAISDISNMIEVKLEELKLYQSITSKFKTNKWKYREGEFYKDTQNAVYRSLAAFCGLEKCEKEGRKFFTQATPVEGSSFESTAQYIITLWNTIVNDSLDDISDAVEKLNESVPNMGIDSAWSKKLRKRITKKMSTSDDITNTIVNAVEKIMAMKVIVVKEVSVDKSLQRGTVNTVLEFDEEYANVVETKDNGLGDAMTKLAIDTDKLPEVIMSDEGEMVVSSIDKSTKVIIGLGSNQTRYIKSISYFSDEIGSISIPLFVPVDNDDCEEEDGDKYEAEKTTTSEINGRWEWLKHTAPAVRFITSRPNYWTSFNDDKDKNLGGYKAAAIEKIKGTKEWIVGLFDIDIEQFIQDEDGNSLVNEEDMIEKINYHICEEIGGTYVSYTNSYVTRENTSENYVIKMLGLSPDVQEAVDQPIDEEIEVDPIAEELEAAALGLMIGDGNISENEIEEDIDIEIDRPEIIDEKTPDIEEEVENKKDDAKEAVGVKANVDWFTPIRRDYQ